MRRNTFALLSGLALAIALVVVIVGGIGFWLGQRNAQQQNPIDAADTALAVVPTVEPSPAPPTPTLIPPPTAKAETAPGATSTAEAAPTATPTTAGTPIAAPSTASVDDVATSLQPAARDALAERPGAPSYTIDARLDPQKQLIVGGQTVRYTNTEDAPLNEIYLRLYVNAPHYNEGGIDVADVQVDGAAAQTALEVDDTALRIALPEPLAPGQSVEIAMRFATTIPSSGGGYGIFNYANDVFTLYNWHPEVAVYEDGGWLLHPVTSQGDPTNTDASNYTVSLTAPDGFTVVTSGDDGDATTGSGQTTHQSVAALARNFVLVVSDEFERVTEDVNGIAVSSYYLPGSAEGGRAALDTTVRSLQLFSDRFGPYPYTEMDVAQVELGGGAAGMEATGLIMIGSQLYSEGNLLGEFGDVIEGAEGADVLAFTTAHEVAHQWWYSVVGSNAFEQPWIDESLTNWSSAFYVDEVVGEEAGLVARDLFIAGPYRGELAAGDQRLDQDVQQFDGSGYGAIVYGKGALMYDVLRDEIGDERFFEFLRRYYAEQRFDRADSDEWLRTLNAVAGRDMTPFYGKWVESTDVQESDLPPGGPLQQLFGG
jgi:hypothetical protein